MTGSNQEDRMSRRVLVDFTHTGRDVTGIERVAIDLFSNDGRYELIHAKNKLDMVFKQWIYIPILGLCPSVAAVVCPGFPPSMMLVLVARKKVVHYIHDLFLIRKSDFLSAIGRYYMAPSFRFSLRRVSQFFVNSLVTADELNAYVRKSSVRVLRPPVRNVFGLEGIVSGCPEPETLDSIKVVTIGTVEPRKGLLAAARLCEEIQRISGKPVILEIFGRKGWGTDWESLSGKANVVLHGYTDTKTIRAALTQATFYLASSTDEGLGLPLLEVQHGGVTVVARDIAVFAEVLGTSGLLIDFNDIKSSSVRILDHLGRYSRSLRQDSAIQNVNRWNRLAEDDQNCLYSKILEMSSSGTV
jgi:glycosyltransferase involved in cell wall biosynthesis